MEASSTSDTLMTLYDCCRVIEAYHEALERHAVLPSEIIQPVDALACSIIVSCFGTHTTIIDCAQSETQGASTVLSRTRNSRAQVLIAPSLRHGPGPWADVLDSYLGDLDTPVPMSPVIAWCENLPVRHPNQVLVLLAAKSDRMVEEVQSWLGRLPKAMVLVFGLGHAGDCKNVASLLACCGRGNHSGDTNSSVTASGHYFTLVRDQGPGFYDSGLALICSHDHPDLQNVLFQLRQFFKGNVTFLSLAKCASQTAITLSCRDREVAALRLIEGSNAFRLAQGLIGMGLVLAPKDSRRRWLAKKTLRGLQILRHDGPQVLIKRMAQKLISKNAGMS